ncbi:MAG TPA: hypothetical protein DC042_09430 [Bacteroidales bacterium]|nr:hypothetical protein [Bacteroidales bacterium]
MTIKTLVLGVLILAGVNSAGKTQETEYKQPSWWFGIATGANFNFYSGSTQQLNSDFTASTAFGNGFGAGVYLASLLEYHRPDSRFGFNLQVGFDSREGSFNQVMLPCNCPAVLKVNLSYVTIEPTLRIAPFRNHFYVYAGPRISFNASKSFEYSEEINPEYPAQAEDPSVNGDFSNINKTLLTVKIGAGYDFPISKTNHSLHDLVSLYISYEPAYGQAPRSIETWNNATLRVGAAAKFGYGSKIDKISSH